MLTKTSRRKKRNNRKIIYSTLTFWSTESPCVGGYCWHCWLTFRNNIHTRKSRSFLTSTLCHTQKRLFLVPSNLLILLLRLLLGNCHKFLKTLLEDSSGINPRYSFSQKGRLDNLTSSSFTAGERRVQKSLFIDTFRGNNFSSKFFHFYPIHFFSHHPRLARTPPNSLTTLWHLFVHGNCVKCGFGKMVNLSEFNKTVSCFAIFKNELPTHHDWRYYLPHWKSTQTLFLRFGSR